MLQAFVVVPVVSGAYLSLRPLEYPKTCFISLAVSSFLRGCRKTLASLAVAA